MRFSAQSGSKIIKIEGYFNSRVAFRPYSQKNPSEKPVEVAAAKGEKGKRRAGYGSYDG